MRKIINGVAYDTKTAARITYWDNYDLIDNVTEFHPRMEELFKKKSGEFFICGDGEAMQRYFEKDMNFRYWSREIIAPITEAQAKEWSEEKLGYDEYEAIFGKAPEVTRRMAENQLACNEYEKVFGKVSE